MSGVAPAVGDLTALERLLGIPEMSWLVQRVRSRMTGPEDALSGVIQLRQATPAQRAAAVALVGRSPRDGAALRVNLADVEQVLRRGPWPAGLADAVVTLTGPVIDRRSRQAREAAAWDRAAARVEETIERFPGAAAWWRSWCAAGGLKRAARSEASRLRLEHGPDVADRLTHAMANIVAALPDSGVPIAVFARRSTGDAHGLDDSRPLGRLAVAVVREAFAGGHGPDMSLSARDVWASAGVVMSNVSSTVLALGVRGASRLDRPAGMDAATATSLDAMAAAGAPMLLTLDQVRSGGVAPLTPDAHVHVCENPTVVEVAAARWAGRGGGFGDPVLVCTSGQPSTAAVELLQLLTSAGAHCHYHGDFDWAGLRIARGLATHVPWQSWRFGAPDYRDAAARDHSSLPLTGSRAESPWDPALAEEMARTGRAIEEEAVADLLADDLVGGHRIT